jgi:hypothetical protein
MMLIREDNAKCSLNDANNGVPMDANIAKCSLNDANKGVPMDVNNVDRAKCFLNDANKGG